MNRYSQLLLQLRHPLVKVLGTSFFSKQLLVEP